MNKALYGLKGWLKPVIFGVCLATGAAHGARAQTVEQTNTVVDTSVSTRMVLPWIADVVKLSQAGVPTDVIQAYVKNSRSHSALTADDVVYLKSRGVASDVVNAMIEHGGQASNLAAVNLPVQPAVAPPVYAQAPAVQDYAPPAYYQPPVDTTDYGDVPSSYYYYNYSYPGYYPYSYFIGYPFGFRARPFFSPGFNRFNRPGGNFGFHGFSGRGGFVSHPTGAVRGGGIGGGRGGGRR
jgi:hypothetical protein